MTGYWCQNLTNIYLKTEFIEKAPTQGRTHMKKNIENHLISNAFNRIASIIFLKGLEEEGEVVHALADYIKFLTSEKSDLTQNLETNLNIIEYFSKLKIYMSSAKCNFHLTPTTFDLRKTLIPNIHETYSYIFDKIALAKGATYDFFVKISEKRDCEEGLQFEIDIYSSNSFQEKSKELINQEEIRKINSSIFMDQSTIISLSMLNSNAISIKFHLYEVSHVSN